VGASLTLAGALVFSLPAPAQQPPDCSVPEFTTAKQTVSGSITVRAGKTCSFETGGLVGKYLFEPGRRIGLFEAEIVQAPRRGTAAIEGSRVIYTPNKAYTGADRFTFTRLELALCSTTYRRTVVMRVTVVP
jgi:hypothetical protein